LFARRIQDPSVCLIGGPFRALSFSPFSAGISKLCILVIVSDPPLESSSVFVLNPHLAKCEHLRRVVLPFLSSSLAFLPSEGAFFSFYLAYLRILNTVIL